MEGEEGEAPFLSEERVDGNNVIFRHVESIRIACIDITVRDLIMGDGSEKGK